MASITALRTLSLHAYAARIPDATEYVSPAYPEVGITVNTPRRKRTLPALWVVWAIVLGVHEMIRQRRFEFAQFEMKWDGEVVGWVHVVDKPAALAVDAGRRGQGGDEVAGRSYPAGLPGSLGVNSSAIILTTNDATIDPAEARLTTTFTPTGTNLGIYDVFLPIMNALSDMAAYPSTRRSDGLVAGYEGYRGVVCILPREPLEYQWQIRAIARIPGYMLEQSRFGEIDILMSIDGVEVAFGRVTNLTTCF